MTLKGELPVTTAYNTLNLEEFYPKTMEIIGQAIVEDTICLKVKSTTHEVSCPLCQISTSSYHSTYNRIV